jgi:aromatic ring-opening dioxygenase LigB subunit
VTEAIRDIRLPAADAVVIVSPHGATTGVYRAASGNLDAFGPRGIAVDAPPAPDLAAAVATAWDCPLLDGPADHGVVVPLRLVDTGDTPVIAVAFEEDLAGVTDGEGLARALHVIDGTIVFVASAHTSAGLTETAPLTSLPGAGDADEAVLAALRSDPAGLVASFGALAAAGSCSVAPLAAFALLCEGRSSELLAYEHPFGVGYPVAVTR